MALTVAQAIARARITFPELDTTTALDLFNDVWTELAQKYSLRDDEIWQAVTADDAKYALAETAVRIQKAYWYTDAQGIDALTPFDKTEWDRLVHEWRVDDSGTPYRYTISSDISGDSSLMQIELECPPNQTTLAVSDATNASPIVITTTTAHGLEDGMAVRPFNVGGNTAANVKGYADVLTTTTFAMYSDADLTTAIAGNGAYTSGGHVATVNSPALRLFITRASAFSSDDTLPNSLMNSDIFVRGVRKKWAEAIHPVDVVQRETVLYQSSLHDWEEFRTQREEGRGVTILHSGWKPKRVT